LSKIIVPYFVKLIDNFEDEDAIYLILELCNDDLENITKGKKLSED
jgi:hypothetical protein